MADSTYKWKLQEIEEKKQQRAKLKREYHKLLRKEGGVVAHSGEHQDNHSRGSSNGASPHRRIKTSKFEKQEKQAQVAKHQREERIKAQQDAERQREEREKNRLRHKKLMTSKTARRQPIMKDRIDRMLDKIKSGST